MPRLSGAAPALWLAALLGFGVLAVFAAVYDTFPADLWLTHRLQEIDSTAFGRAVDWAEDLTDAPVIIAVWLGGSAALLALAGRRAALILLLSMAFRLLNLGLKELIQRPRPPGYESDTFSFPSGHSQGAVILYGLLFYFATALIPWGLPRLLARLGCLWVVLFTGLERVYVGAHWPSDVLGGFYIGALALALLIAADRLVTAKPEE